MDHATRELLLALDRGLDLMTLALVGHEELTSCEIQPGIFQLAIDLHAEVKAHLALDAGLRSTSSVVVDARVEQIAKDFIDTLPKVTG